jgi:ubiquitin carboxyl-terminal hydrolase 4/11/15
LYIFQNANAYLLFYRRRTTEPLGGKTQAKIDAARLKRNEEPSEPSSDEGVVVIDPRVDDDLDIPGLTTFLPRSTRSASSSSPSSLRDDPPDLDDGIDLVSDDPLVRSGQRFDFPDPSSNKASPASSTEAEGDPEENWTPYTFGASGSPNWSPLRSPGTIDMLHSPSENSSLSDVNPFLDGYAETASSHLKID